MNLSFVNQTFRGEEPTWANACVGDNGAPDILDYARGFASAATVLLDSAIASRGIEHAVDTLVYPVCFTMRHAIELVLKKVADDLARIADIRGVKLPAFSLTGSHDLGLIWAYVKDHGTAADERLVELLGRLDEYVLDVANMDATGQVFRYPFDVDNKKHLTHVGVINFLVLKCRFDEAQQLLEALTRMVSELVDEYRWGTFTKTLSRHQLGKLAAVLPPRSKWSDASFDGVRDELKAKYKLSSKELGKALDHIQLRHEMAARIGLQVAIPGLSVSALHHLFDKWCEVNELQDVISPPPARIVNGGDLIEAFLLDDQKRQDCGKALADQIDPDAYATIQALFEFEDDEPVSEAFDRTLANCQREAGLNKADPARYRQSLWDMMGKSRAFERILYSLNFLGQAEALEAIVHRYGLEQARERLLEFSERRKNR